MKRQDKVRLLRDIAAGRKTIGETLPPIIRIWVQDETDPVLFHCETEGLTMREDERLNDKNNGRRILNIFIHWVKCSPISVNQHNNNSK